MRLLTKAEACGELRLSLSTLNRRIAAGKVPVRRELRGRRHRVYVMLDDDPPEDGGAADSASAAAQERIRNLEAQVEFQQAQLDQERQRNVQLLNAPKPRQSIRPFRSLSSKWWVLPAIE